MNRYIAIYDRSAGEHNSLALLSYMEPMEGMLKSEAQQVPVGQLTNECQRCQRYQRIMYALPPVPVSRVA